MIHPLIVWIYSLVVFEPMPWASPAALVVKNLPANAGDRREQVQSLGGEDPLEKGMATHSSILTYKTPWTEPTLTQWAAGHGVSESQTDRGMSTYTHSGVTSVTQLKGYIMSCHLLSKAI